jgi:hypothetical protein
MGSSFQVFAGPQATLKRNCVSQLMINLSTLGSITALLIQVVPTMLNRLQ